MKYLIYLILFLVFLASFLMATYLPIEDIWKGIATTPAIAALSAIIYQILKDHTAHQRKKEIQQSGHDFSLGVTSHMAQVAFDKHVEFCEKYMSEVHETMSTLWREGPTREAKTHSNNFFMLRVEYATWVTEEIANKLTNFEDTLLKIGAKAALAEALNQKTADEAFQAADDSWLAVLGIAIDKKKTPDENIAIESIKNRIRNILGVQELTELRGALIKKAISSVNT
ncbi:MAG: hypothetical protein GY710_15675 [Desulfobacteraceae bacterium]|nr:hypothetical protein [Desulfobacteraceae bacterium]